VGGELVLAEAEERGELDPRLEGVADRSDAVGPDDAEAVAKAWPEDAQDRWLLPVLEDDESPEAARGGAGTG
jgi:hypothetical protein